MNNISSVDVDKIASKLAMDATSLARTRKVLAKGQFHAHIAMAARFIGLNPELYSFNDLQKLCYRIVDAADNYSRIANTKVKCGSHVEIQLTDKTITGKVVSIEPGGHVMVKTLDGHDRITPTEWNSVKILKAA